MEYYGNNDFRDYSLAHFGVLGMKWGVRRYQNPDGTLTAAGRARYGGEISSKYSDSQRMRDERIYGKRAAKRINKRLLSGEDIQGARHAEVVNKERKQKAVKVLSTAALLGGAVFLRSSKGQAILRKAFTPSVINISTGPEIVRKSGFSKDLANMTMKDLADLDLY